MRGGAVGVVFGRVSVVDILGQSESVESRKIRELESLSEKMGRAV